MTRGRRVVRAVLVCVVLLCLFQLVWWTEPAWLFGLLEWMAPGIVWRVPTTLPIVALSFDDGPSPAHTPEVLAILSQYEAHATFFLIGQRALAHPELVQAIKAAGHEVGNHYFVNGVALADDTAKFRANLERAEEAIGLAGAPKLFRPPSGLAWPWQLRMARESGYTSVLGSAYPHDPAHPPVRYIEWLIEKNLRPGVVIILHDGIPDPSRGIQALPHILATGRERGLRFVSVGELLRER